MGYEYILVDSKHRKEHETDSKIEVQLSAPIHHAKSVKLVSFSCPNEFFNVTDLNNTFQLISYNCSKNTRASPRTVTVTPGLYSISELITVINDDLSAAYSSTGISLSLLANNKVQMVATSASSSIKRLILFHKKNTHFFKSIAYRLGFSRKQVSPYNNTGLFTGDGASPPVVSIDLNGKKLLPRPNGWVIPAPSYIGKPTARRLAIILGCPIT